MKNIPNMLTGLRIVLSALLFFPEPLSPGFILLYVTCGVSDIMDGFLARKLNITSKLGSRLDSAADMIFISALLILLLPRLKLSKPLLLWIISIALIRIVSSAVAFYKYGKFASLHTYGNKAAGFALFCCPLLLSFVDVNMLGYVLCIIAALSAVEELAIQILSKELNTDIKGLFIK